MIATMKALMAEVVDTGGKRDKRGRRIERAEHRAVMIAAYARSGLTQRAFAEREGLKFNTFVAWLGRDRRRTTRPTFAEVAVKAPVRATVEVALPDGTVVRSHDPEQLVAVVQRLRQC